MAERSLRLKGYGERSAVVRNLVCCALAVGVAATVGRTLWRWATGHPVPLAGTGEVVLVSSLLAALGAWIGWRARVSTVGLALSASVWILLFAAGPIVTGMFPESGRALPYAILSWATQIIGPVAIGFVTFAWLRGRQGP